MRLVHCNIGLACYCDRMTTRTLFKAAAWLMLAGILFVTISPIGLRPSTITNVNIDRALAYALAACAFVLAYPRQWKIVAVLLLAGAGAMELLQYLSPSRHPQAADATVVRPERPAPESEALPAGDDRSSGRRAARLRLVDFDQTRAASRRCCLQTSR